MVHLAFWSPTEIPHIPPGVSQCSGLGTWSPPSHEGLGQRRSREESPASIVPLSSGPASFHPLERGGDAAPSACKSHQHHSDVGPGSASGWNLLYF